MHTNNFEPIDKQNASVSVLVFRLNNQWIALKSQCIEEISPPKPIHYLPFRTDSFLLGIVNWNGVLRLCFSLKNILQIDKDNDSSSHTGLHHQNCMLLTHYKSHYWIFPVNEVEGIQKINCHDIDISTSQQLFSRVKSQKDTQFNQKELSIIHEDMLYTHLQKSFL